MKIAILGTRGIPNNYGGFEQFAEYLSLGLIEKKIEVSVYSSHNHKYTENTWKGVNIIHCHDPEYKVGTVGQFLYDLNCILDSRKRNFDIILQLGYTSSSVWNFLFKKNVLVLTNMDGLEWKRSKYNRLTQRFLKFAEGLAVRKSSYLISDSIGIQSYLQKTYKVNSEYIPYGATVFNDCDSKVLNSYNLIPYEYNMLIARLEPENSIEIILDGVVKANASLKMLIIGKYETTYGKYLVNKYKNYNHIIFLGPLYDIQALNNLRWYSNIYFHGHTVGGTNPSLLEAMASGALVAAHNNDFNKYILGDDAYYFNTKEDVAIIVNTVLKREHGLTKLSNNQDKIKSIYSWDKIINSYESFFSRCYKAK